MNSRKVTAFALVVTAIPFIALFAGPIWDIDVFWHLATGREIVHTGRLLQNDPFTFIPLAEMDATRLLLLNNFWLAQVTFYVFFLLAGLHGVVGLKVILLVLVPILTLLTCIRLRLNIWPALVVALLQGFLLQSYTAERPQAFSFFFFAALIALLTRTGYARRDDEGKTFTYSLTAAALIPLIMLVWANCHPAFMLGNVVIILFLAGESAKKYFLKYPIENRSFRRLMGILLAALMATLLNPNFVGQYFYLFSLEGSQLQQRTTEYLSPLTLWQNYDIIVYPYLFYLVLFLLCWGINWRRIDPTQMLIAFSLMILSFRAFRYIPFFLLGTGIELTAHATTLLAARARMKLVTVATASVMVVFLWVSGVKAYKGASRHSHGAYLAEDRFPSGAASFVQKVKPAGNIFNHFDWGGYLIWTLYPQNRVFIDGRALSAKAFDEFTRILWMPYWKNILDRHEINVIIIPGLDPFSGELYELTKNLFADGEWSLVYRDSTALVAMRGEANRQIIERWALPKEEIYRHVVAQGERLFRSGMANRNLFLALATAYGKLNMNNQAVEAKQRADSLR